MTENDDLGMVEHRVIEAAVFDVLVRLEGAVTAHDHLLSDLVQAVAKTVPPDALENVRKHLEDTRRSRTEAVAEIARVRELLTAALAED